MTAAAEGQSGHGFALAKDDEAWPQYPPGPLCLSPQAA